MLTLRVGLWTLPKGCDCPRQDVLVGDLWVGPHGSQAGFGMTQFLVRIVHLAMATADYADEVAVVSDMKVEFGRWLRTTMRARPVPVDIQLDDGRWVSNPALHVS